MFLFKFFVNEYDFKYLQLAFQLSRFSSENCYYKGRPATDRQFIQFNLLLVQFKPFPFLTGTTKQAEHV